MNVDALVAIDIHTHAEVSTRMLPDEAEAEALEARGRYFRYEAKHPTIAQMAQYYRSRKMGFVVFTVDHERGMGIKRISNEEVAESAAEHADVAIPFASIDPARGKMGVREARRLIKDFGVKGFKFHPIIQGFYPNDPDVYPLYEVIAQAGLPALFHTGQTGIGAGMRGGGGLRLKYANPIFLDDVAADFPDMPIIMAHPSVPWQDEQLSVATHKPNAYIDLSGWSPKYFEAKLVQYANTLLKNKVLFGSDNPVIQPDRWLADFEKLPIKPEVRPLILKENAVKLLKLK
ncbi:MAG: amidohydrolase family protein [Betaproteobacteria bacterium]|nr:amidohydrolase family protein [Betaproteobacteria bacterium]